MDWLMDFDAVTERLVKHATDAGRALRNPIKDVAFAHPIPTSERCVRVYYDGEESPAEMIGADDDLTGRLIGERLVIVAFWAISTNGIIATASVEAEIRQYKHELRTRLLGDTDLNTNPEAGGITNLYVDYATADFTVINGTVYRWLELGSLALYEEYALG